MSHGHPRSSDEGGLLHKQTIRFVAVVIKSPNIKALTASIVAQTARCLRETRARATVHLN